MGTRNTSPRFPPTGLNMSSVAKTEANNAKNKRDSQGNKIADKGKASGQADIDKDLKDQFEKSQEHKRLSGKHGHTGLGFKPDEEEETQQESAVKKANDNNNTGSPIENLDDEDDEEEDEDKSLDDEEDDEDDLSDEDDEDDDVNEDISDEDDDGEVPTDAKKMKLIEEESH